MIHQLLAQQFEICFVLWLVRNKITKHLSVFLEHRHITRSRSWQVLNKTMIIFRPVRSCMLNRRRWCIRDRSVPFSILEHLITSAKSFNYSSAVKSMKYPSLFNIVTTLLIENVNFITFNSPHLNNGWWVKQPF